MLASCEGAHVLSNVFYPVLTTSLRGLEAPIAAGWYGDGVHWKHSLLIVAFAVGTAMGLSISLMLARHATHRGPDRGPLAICDGSVESCLDQAA